MLQKITRTIAVSILILLSTSVYAAEIPGYVSLSSMGKCMDSQGASSSNGTNIVLWQCNGGNNQQWLMDEMGRFHSAMNYNKCLDIEGANPSNGANVILWQCHNNLNQQWYWDGNSILSKMNGKAIDVEWASSSNGANILMWSPHGGVNQQWAAQSNKSECITVYEHWDYQGRSWELCGLGRYTAPGAFGDNIISSIQIPEGLSVTACDAADDNSNCRVFSEDVPNLSEISALNDRISAININKNRFSMIVMGDPQLWWSCHYEGCEEKCDSQETGCHDGDDSNSQQLDSINETVMDQVNVYNFKGIIINGDLTAFGHGKQLNQFENYYYNSGLRIFPGLGNHDYQNNVNDCFDNDCAFRMINWFEQKIGALKNEGTVWAFDFEKINRDHYGSLAYAWIISDYLFIQLNNYPSYEIEFKDIVHWEEAYIRNSYDFLEMCLDYARLHNKKVVINQHVPVFTNRAIEILSSYNNVVAVFAGHVHERAGHWPTKDILLNNNRIIPVFYSGSPDYARYLLVDFGTKDIIVNTVNSQSQDFGVIDSYQISVE